MTFDNRPDTITEIFDGCLTRGQVYRRYISAVGSEYRRFNPPLSNRDKVMGMAWKDKGRLNHCTKCKLNPENRFKLEIKDLHVFKLLPDYRRLILQGISPLSS